MKFNRDIIDLSHDNFYDLKSLLVFVCAMKKYIHFLRPDTVNCAEQKNKIINTFPFSTKNRPCPGQQGAMAERACDCLENMENICILSGILL